MTRSLRKIVFVVEEFALGTPAQQLLDRFLAGYPRDGTFHRLDGCRVVMHLTSGAAGNPEIAHRIKDFGLVSSANLDDALAGADAVVVTWRGHGVEANGELLTTVLQRAPAGSPVFVEGMLSKTFEGAKELSELAASRSIPLVAGTATAVTYRLPAVDLKRGTRVTEALIVVQGRSPEAEFDALEGLLPLLERRRGGRAGVEHVRFLEGESVWRARDQGQWSQRLLAAALSRSDSPQGDPVKDGRTQDLVGLGLVPRLARDPRGWLVRHRDGLRSAILVLDGVVADYNFAVATAEGTMISAQLYRPWEPAQAHFNLLAAAVENFFRSGKAPWPVQRSQLIAGLIEVFNKSEARTGAPWPTPHLKEG
ncbi:MAG: hypothetical protein ACYDH9_10225 [Limisphaerales bacterium]